MIVSADVMTRRVVEKLRLQKKSALISGTYLRDFDVISL